MYDLHNTAAGPRVVYDRRHRPILVQPGATRRGVDLERHTVDILKSRGSRLKVSLSRRTAVDRPTVMIRIGKGAKGEARRSALDHDGDGRPGGSKPGTLGAEPVTVAQLFAAADELPYPTLAAEAKRTLGDAWPGGKPKKAEIIEALARALD
jgi:hypothetical protein